MYNKHIQFIYVFHALYMYLQLIFRESYMKKQPKNICITVKLYQNLFGGFSVLLATAWCAYLIKYSIDGLHRQLHCLT